MPSARAWLSPVIAISLGLSACSGSLPTAGPSLSPSGVQHASLVVDGHKRTYRLFRPPTLDLTRPPSLVLALHGAPSSGDELASISHFDDEAMSGGFIVAYPDALYGAWNPDTPGPVEDVAFMVRLLDRLQHEFTVERTHTFIAGVSNGAMMAYRLACELSDRVAAIASVAGEMRLQECQPARPVSILEMHGTDDSSVPYDGGVAAIRRWVTLDGCTGHPTQSVSGITKTSIWSGCREGTVIRLDTVVGGHHTWFGSAFAPVPGEPSSNAVIWAFFSMVVAP